MQSLNFFEQIKKNVVFFSFCERRRKRREKKEASLLLFLALGQMGWIYSAECKGEWKNYLKLSKIILT